ncbi:MAG: Na+/H+ antiporter subunit E [Thioalkalispiraceae bacterium]
MRSHVSGLILRTLIFLVIWRLITDGDPASWWIGLPAVVLAVIASHSLLPKTSVNWYELFKFIPYFFIRSLVGGIDVARRAFHQKLPIAPALIEYPLRLPTGFPQVFFINTVSLLPGTLIADSHGDTLEVHVLDETSGFIDEIRSVEQRVAKIFVVTLAERDNG